MLVFAPSRVLVQDQLQASDQTMHLEMAQQSWLAADALMAAMATESSQEDHYFFGLTAWGLPLHFDNILGFQSALFVHQLDFSSNSAASITVVAGSNALASG